MLHLSNLYLKLGDTKLSQMTSLVILNVFETTHFATNNIN